MSASNQVTVGIASSDALDVRSFHVSQQLSELFEVDVRAVSTNLDIDFDAVIGQSASFGLRTQWTAQSWTGICSHVEQVRVDEHGLATYRIVLVPRAWLMTQRTNFRIFQMKTELDIVKQMLSEWSVPFEERVNPGAYKPRKYTVQYGESDFAFVSRLLEAAGVSYCFAEREGDTVMVLDDAPATRSVQKPLIRYHDTPQVTSGEFVTRVEVAQRVRAGRVTLGDVDYRKPSANQPRLSAGGGLPQEEMLEHYHHEPGVFLFRQSSGGGGTPSADDRGASRTDPGVGNVRTKGRLEGERNDAIVVSFESNALDLAPGVVMSTTNHPHRLLAMDNSLLVTSSTIAGDHNSTWRAEVEVAPADAPYRPKLKTPRPVVRGLESATVVGPGGEEIHTDEFGRVRVQFHWDREGQRDDNSSCWIPTNQPWAGAGFGGVALPRVGQEVLIEFLNGDPDRPVVIGRVYTEMQSSPYKLPKYKNVSGLRSETTPRLVMGASGPGTASPSSSLLGGGTKLSSSEIHDLVTNDGPFKAASPNGAADQWKGSELVMDDTAGKEIAYLQAQNDFNLVVKNSWTTVVGNQKNTRIGTDEKVTIGNKQEVNVTADRTIKVTGKEETTVEKEIVQKTNSTTSVTAKKFVAMKSDRHICFEVGSSYITVLSDSIVIQASHLDINPKE